MASDHIMCGSKIIKYEFLHEDVEGISNPDLGGLLKDWKVGTRNQGVLTKEEENFLEKLVADNYYKIYQSFDI